MKCSGTSQGNAMKKIIAVAALVAAGFAAPSMPVQAASAYPAKCLILPLLQAECREAIKGTVNAATASTKKVASASTTAAIKLPMWWTCKASTAKGKLLECE